MIIFEEVTKEFGNGKVALEQINFSIDPGEFVAIQGPSGAGKTTLLRLMIKEIPDYQGTIKIDGDDISKIGKRNTPFLRRKIGAVFQDFKILLDRTVSENIALALDILNLEDSVIESRINELLELTGIPDKAPMFPSQLSGGELQRVVLARALAPQPKIIFADEPTGNLDKDTAWQIIQLLKDINEQETAVILATHDENIVSKLKVRTITLDEGKVVKDTGAKSKPKSKTKDEQKDQDKKDKPATQPDQSDEKKSTNSAKTDKKTSKKEGDKDQATDSEDKKT